MMLCVKCKRFSNIGNRHIICAPCREVMKQMKRLKPDQFRDMHQID